jgi:AcrR family transcriptional regulator
MGAAEARPFSRRPGEGVKRPTKTAAPDAQRKALATALSQRMLRIRMAPHDRERLIVDHAMRFFAEKGLDGQTRELARRLGITQSLIYRYFPSKDALIERVYEKWFSEFWNPAWPKWIVDRREPLEDRLLRFYRDYARVIYTYEWVRLFAFSGLYGCAYHFRFVTRNREELYPWIAAELRHDHGLPTLQEIPLTEFEIEQIVSMHATALWVGQRRWLYRLPVPVDISTLVAARIRSFITAAPVQIAAHLQTLPSVKLAGD